MKQHFGRHFHQLFVLALACLVLLPVAQISKVSKHQLKTSAQIMEQAGAVESQPQDSESKTETSSCDHDNSDAEASLSLSPIYFGEKIFFEYSSQRIDKPSSALAKRLRQPPKSLFS